MLDLYKAIDSLRKINEGLQQGDLELGDRVKHTTGARGEVIDLDGNTVVIRDIDTDKEDDILEFPIDELQMIFGMDAVTDQEKQDMSDMFDRLEKSGGSHAMKSHATEDDMQNIDERVTYNTLAKLSGIKDPNKINIGQKVKLPNGKNYTVKKGDTLSGIAEKYRLLMKNRKQDTAPSQKDSPGNPFSPDKKITPSQKGSPGNPFSPDKKIKDKPTGVMPLAPPSKNIDKNDPRNMPNQYVQNKDGTYTPKNDNDSVIGNPFTGLGKFVPDAVKNYKFGDMQKAFNKFVGGGNKKPQSYADRRKETKQRDMGINPYKSNTKLANKKMPDMSSKQPTKTMIEQITGKKTCL